MKRLNYIIAAGLSLVAAAACNKQVSPAAEQPEVKAGRTMTLTASIGDPGTKLSFSEADNVLKGTWGPNEQISVITLDGSKKVKTVDTFTSGPVSAGKRSADFSGTLSEDATEDIRVLYPALTDTYTLTGTEYLVTAYSPGQSGSALTTRVREGSSAATFRVNK